MLKSIPMGTANMPGMSLPPEIRHLIAIHVWDNLRCSPPRDPLYVYREPRGMPAGARAAGAGGVWVPIKHANDDAFAEDTEKIMVADVTDWTPQRLEAQRLAIAAEERRQRLIAQADPHIHTAAQAGEGDTPTPAGEGV